MIQYVVELRDLYKLVSPFVLTFHIISIGTLRREPEMRSGTGIPAIMPGAPLSQWEAMRGAGRGNNAPSHCGMRSVWLNLYEEWRE